MRCLFVCLKFRNYLTAEETGNKIPSLTGERGNLYEFSYIRFALEEKELFQYLFMQEKCLSRNTAGFAAGNREGDSPVYGKISSFFMTRHIISTISLWMHAHGIASMAATEFCQWNLEKVKRMLEECEYYLSRKYGV